MAENWSNVSLCPFCVCFFLFPLSPKVGKRTVSDLFNKDKKDPKDVKAAIEAKEAKNVKESKEAKMAAALANISGGKPSLVSLVAGGGAKGSEKEPTKPREPEKVLPKKATALTHTEKVIYAIYILLRTFLSIGDSIHLYQAERWYRLVCLGTRFCLN